MTETTESRHSTADSMFLPLHAARGRYFYSGSLASVGSPRTQVALKALLERAYEPSPGVAEIAGRLYQTYLYIPVAEDGIAYVETDHNGVPIDAPRVQEIPLEVVSDYLDSLRARCLVSDALSPDTRVPLNAAFIPPRFTVIGSQPEEVISWDQFRSYARVVIVGAPGAGKTSCLRRLALDVTSDRRLSFDTLPIFIQLRDFPVDDLRPTGIKRLLDAGRIPELVTEFDPPLHGGRLLLIIDGLDELPSPGERDIFLKSLTNLCRDLPRLRVALTTRDSVPRGSLEDFTQLQLLPFDNARIEQWAVQYLGSHRPERSRNDFIDLLRHDSELCDLASNPLLLGLTSSLYWKSPDELNDRAGLLRKVIEVLVEDWDSVRGVARWRYSSITPRQIKSLLAVLSVLLIKKQDSEFSTNDVQDAISETTGFRESPLVLISACRTSGLVRDTGVDRWRFTHRSFQDYLAARHLILQTDDVADLIRTYASEDEDRSLWSMSCALASNADGLLSAALAQQQSAEKTAAIMVAKALGQEISASNDIIDKCCSLIVSTLEDNLRHARPLDAERLRTLQSRSADRSVVWAGGAIVDNPSMSDTGLETTARLFNLIHRARSGVAGTTLRTHLQSSSVPAVQQAAEALRHSGWCDAAVVAGDYKQVLCIVITRSTFTPIER